MENILKIKGNEVKIISKDIIEMPEEIKTPQGLFLFLKNNKNEIEEVTVKAKEFDKEMLVAVSICENFYYNVDEKERIGVIRENGTISLSYEGVWIYTSNVETPCQSDNIREMFYTGNTEDIAPLVKDNREKYKKLFQLYPLVKSENQVFDLTFIPGEWIIIDKEVKNVANLSMIIAKEFVASVVNGKAIDEITFHSETIENWRNIHYSKNDDYLILKSEKAKIEFEEDTATCYCNGNEYIFNENEMIDYDQRVSAEERHNDLKEIKKLLKLSLQLINSKVIENMVKTVENSGELVDAKFSLIIGETFISTIINDDRIDEITFYSEFCEPQKLSSFTTRNLLLRFKDTEIKFDDENDAMACQCNGNKYIFGFNEITDIDTSISIEEMQRDLKEIKKLLELSLNLTDYYRVKKMIKTVENIGEFSEFKNKMKILENFETL